VYGTGLKAINLSPCVYVNEFEKDERKNYLVELLNRFKTLLILVYLGKKLRE
jgi:hypothetical protein